MISLKFWWNNYKIKKQQKREAKRLAHFADQKAPKVCEAENCQHKLNFLCYDCPYCYKYFCEAHRIPEDHNCTGSPKLPEGMKAGGRISWSRCKK